MKRRLAFAGGLTLALTLGALASGSAQRRVAAVSAPPPGPEPLLKAHCLACHNPRNPQGKLDLSQLSHDLRNPKISALWKRLHDRVQAGEMPPPEATPLSPRDRSALLKALAVPLQATEGAQVQREGRAVLRRMNRYEYENTVRDLLQAPWLQLKDQLPEDGEAYRFNKVGEALDVSHVQMSRYLSAAEYALQEVLEHAAAPEPSRRRFYAREQGGFTGHVLFTQFNGSPERATFPLLGNEADQPVLDNKAPMTVGAKDPAKREQEAMGVVASTYEPLEIRFNRFKAPAAGRYRLRLRAHSFWALPESERRWWQPSRTKLAAGRTREPITLYSEIPPRLLRKLGTVEVGIEPTERELEVYLLEGETIRPDAVRLFRSRPPGWHNPLATKEGQPGVAFQWLEVEGPLKDPDSGYARLFDDLPLQRVGKKLVVLPRDAQTDATRLIRRFMALAYRRPLTETDPLPFQRLALRAMEQGESFQDALLTAYAAVLCSPTFLTLEERPGLLGNHALASRLAYFLTNSAPDPILRTLADRGELTRPETLRAQTERLLADPKSGRFVGAFLDYWLDLRKAFITSPDELLYPDYYLDDYLIESSVDETQHFFTELVQKNLPARNLVDSGFVTINERMAQHYGITGVEGPAFRRVALPADSPRGGLLTQASVLKVTANGTTTSPVLRGAWIMERILGQPAPPPPSAVPAVEPDIRGAATIRQQLDKHRTDINCKGCHAKIDPAGFALESFDVCGGWRERYRGIAEGKERLPGYGKNGQPFTFHAAQPIDASGELPDGRRFRDVRELKRLLTKDERLLARNLAQQLVIFGTGAPVRFGDRPQLEAILDKAAPSGYGVRSLIHAIVESELFRSK